MHIIHSLRWKNIAWRLNLAPKQQSIIFYVAWLVVVGAILGLNLLTSSFFSSASQAEIDILNLTAEQPNIFVNFLYYPYYLLIWLLRLVISDGLFVIRLVSWLAALLASGSLLFILRQQLGVLTSVAGASFFVFNAWILQLTQIGSPAMSVIACGLALVATLLLLRQNRHSLLLKVWLTGLAVVSWFMPLLPWLVAGLAVLVFYQKRRWSQYFGLSFKLLFLVCCFGLLGVSWLSFSQNQTDIFIAFGIPDQVENFNLIANNLMQTVQALVWQAPDNAQFYLARLPFLDIFAAAMLPFGFYFVARKTRAISYVLLALVVLLGLASLNQGIMTAGVVLLFPMLAGLIGAGVHELIDSWRQTFPFNPLAKALGVSIIVFLIAFSLFYQVQKYFVAYVNHPQTQQIYKEDD